MKIENMFARDITRDLDGVIVVGDKNKANVRQELEEYVVTKELLRHFEDFFANYKQGINGNTTNTGVWISGFFGSGKSHFLKIISYLLDDTVVDGKHALQYLQESGQIDDPALLADMQLAADTPTDVMLFNIDAKSDQSGKQREESIVMVFLKVFNEMQGFYGSMPRVADLERHLTKEGRYEEFKEVFEKNYGRNWQEGRHDFYYAQDVVVKTLEETGIMSEESARNWCKDAMKDYRISIEEFAKMVREYLDSKGPDQHIAFLVDEIGQYIGDNSQLMLNLQTLREELGKECRGRAWIIVTSQQDIDSITKVKGNDFSKIQGRFTRISLSSANVDEVIRERILKKTDVADQTLRFLYEQKSTQLSNIITFENTAEMKLYSGEDEFASVYPFVPYQFKLLAASLTSIRKHSASGKHLSEGERSMLALFKESAEAQKDRDETTLIPFYMFYDPLEKFLDASHSRVIRQAAENRRINPDGSEDCFAVNVLKCLFMIKYVKEFEQATLENITSLMISSVDEDRALLEQNVENALKVLISETLVQKHNNIYVFLTEEEQEIGRDIERIEIGTGDVKQKVCEIVFDQILTYKRCSYPKFNGRYTFPFNRVVDDYSYGTGQIYDIGVRILTPYSGETGDEASMISRTLNGREVLFVMPESGSYIDEITKALKIYKYLQPNSYPAAGRYEEIRDKKQKEMSERYENAKRELSEDLKHADIYMNGHRAAIPVKEADDRIREALNALIDTVYHKLSYIDSPYDENDILRMLKKSGGISAGDVEGDANAQAQADVLSFIRGKSASHEKTSMRTLKDKFSKAPYGFVDDDVEWLIARLFVRGDITLTYNGSQISKTDVNEDDLVHKLTRKEYSDKLLADFREKRSAGEIKCAVELMKELFDRNMTSDDEDFLMKEFQQSAQKLLGELNSSLNNMYRRPYPGRDVVERGAALMRSTVQEHFAAGFYSLITQERDALEDFADDYDAVNNFFGGNQRKLFDEALDLVELYDDSEAYIINNGLGEVTDSIREILNEEKPYSSIYKLPELLKKFHEMYSDELEKAREPVITTIRSAMTDILDDLENKSYKDKYEEEFRGKFQDLLNGTENCESITVVRVFADKAKKTKMNILNRIDELDMEIEKKKQAEGTNDPPCKTKNRFDIKDVINTSSWRIESREDIDRYLEELRRGIESKMEDNTIINIEF